MTPSRSAVGPATWKIVTAFLAVYIVWGSTYLAIRFAVETLPPFLMAGLRFLVAGTMLYLWARYKGAARPTLPQWRTTALIGGLLLLGGNGGVVWAEQHVPSGLTALMVATVPLWVVLIDWYRPRGTKPTVKVVLGIVLGLCGIILLAAPGTIAGGKNVDLIGAVVLVMASLFWATGSVWSRHVKLPASSLLTTGMEMLAGGVLLTVLGTAVGDWPRLMHSQVTLRSVLALAYLVVFGSLVGFTSYMWLLKVTSPARVATYAYVNPVVAVIVGWLFANEPMNLRTLLAAAVIIAGVVFITKGARPAATQQADERVIEAGEPAAVAVCTEV